MAWGWIQRGNLANKSSSFLSHLLSRLTCMQLRLTGLRQVGFLLPQVTVWWVCWSTNWLIWLEHRVQVTQLDRRVGKMEMIWISFKDVKMQKPLMAYQVCMYRNITSWVLSSISAGCLVLITSIICKTFVRLKFEYDIISDLSLIFWTLALPRFSCFPH